MVTNTNALNTAIRKSKLTKTHIAATLKISREALRQKSSNITEFKGSEIEKISDMLELSMSDKNAIFFARKVDTSPTTPETKK